MHSRHLPELIVSAVIVALVGSTGTFAASQSTAGSSFLSFGVKSPVPRGQLALVVVQGRAGLCRITVSKGRIQMHASTRVNPLRPKLASNALNDTRVSWQWWTPTNTALGRWQVRVNCGRSATLRGTLLITTG